MEIVFQVLPYALALILAVGSLPNRILAARYKNSVTDSNRRFARRWATVANFVSLPLIALAVATSRIGMRAILDSQVQKSPALTLGLVAVLAVVVLTLGGFFLIARDINEDPWPGWIPFLSEIIVIGLSCYFDLSFQ